MSLLVDAASNFTKVRQLSNSQKAERIPLLQNKVCAKWNTILSENNHLQEIPGGGMNLIHCFTALVHWFSVR